MNIRFALAFAALMSAPFTALAQTTPPAATQPKAPDPDPTMLRAMKSKVFEIKYVNPLWLTFSLRSLGSGVRGCSVDHTNQEGLRTVTVRDFPENLAAIEAAIKQMDKPTTTPVQEVELQVQVLFASKQAVPETGIPDDLQPVLKSLKGALAYRGYTLAATFVQRWNLSNGWSIQGKGQIDGSGLGFGTIKEPSMLRIGWEALSDHGVDPMLNALSALQIPKFRLRVSESNASGSKDLAEIETSVNLKEGEHVVVGTSVIKDQGLVVVLTSRVLR